MLRFDPYYEQRNLKLVSLRGRIVLQFPTNIPPLEKLPSNSNVEFLYNKGCTTSADVCVCVCISRVPPPLPNKHLNKVVVSILKREDKKKVPFALTEHRDAQRGCRVFFVLFIFILFKNCHITRCVTVTYIGGSVNFPHCAT